MNHKVGEIIHSYVTIVVRVTWKTDGMQQSLNSKVEFFTQAGVITKELVEESGTNLTQMTWLEVEDSKGGVGYVQSNF